MVIVVLVVALVSVVTVAALFGFHMFAKTSSARPASQTTSVPASSVAASVTSPVTASATPPSGSTDPNPLVAEFAEFAKGVNAKVGAVVSAVGNDQPPTKMGEWDFEGPAWSTIKVPLVIADYRVQNEVTGPMRSAITESDNAAAEAVWAQLGEPAVAGPKVQAILQETGDPTPVQHERVRPPFTAFGQTKWSLVNQAKFISSAYCNPKNHDIFDLMGQIVAGQSWGIGSISGTKFKGGWGPSTDNKYLVRQIGVLKTTSGYVGVAIKAEAPSGSFDDGRAALDKVAHWLQEHLDSLPFGQCSG